MLPSSTRRPFQGRTCGTVYPRGRRSPSRWSQNRRCRRTRPAPLGPLRLRRSSRTSPSRCARYCPLSPVEDRPNQNGHQRTTTDINGQSETTNKKDPIKIIRNISNSKGAYQSTPARPSGTCRPRNKGQNDRGHGTCFPRRVRTASC